ncbi:MAG: hypothetical protein JW920_05840 [Deltaproteobacteria bacterium]|nr:hypothetical protein [Deltaproteobacteria bacterium]
MQKIIRMVILLSILLAFAISGCNSSGSSSSTSQNESSNEETGGETNDPEENPQPGIEDVLAAQGLTLVNSVTTDDGDTGYLAVFDDKFSEGVHDNNQEETVRFQKSCLILTGSAFNMGYQAGYLMPAETQLMTSTFLKGALCAQMGNLGLDIDPDSDLGNALFEIFYDQILIMLMNHFDNIPEFIRDEMLGVADGARAAGYDVAFQNVLGLNEGMDALFTLLANLLIQPPDPDEFQEGSGAEMREQIIRDLENLQQEYPRLRNDIIINGDHLIFPKAKDFEFPKFGCNGFVLSQGATAETKTYHGRDFMFSTGHVYQDAACVMVYLPDEGYPFVTVSTPGFVGHAVGINSEGLSFGVDISLAASFASQPGECCLTIIRTLLQTCTDIPGAIDRFKQFQRGVPWNFVIGDDQENAQYGPGVVLEVGRSSPHFNGPDLLPPWEQALLSTYIDMLDDEEPDRGVMIRSAKWIFPQEFSSVGFTLPWTSPFFPLQDRWDLGFYFPDQIETNPDILAATNHFIIPRMRFTQFYPLVQIMYAIEPLPESVWRYETMLGLILDNYGEIEFFVPDQDNPQIPSDGCAAGIIDFLNTQRGTGFYTRGDEPKAIDGEVEGHHVIMDNTDKVLKGLFGYMTDPWVGVELMPFVEWFYGE